MTNDKLNIGLPVQPAQVLSTVQTGRHGQADVVVTAGGFFRVRVRDRRGSWSMLRTSYVSLEAAEPVLRLADDARARRFERS